MHLYRSSNSWQCPFCSHTLSTKATNLTVASPDDPTKPSVKKSYYQACNFCRWTSRSVGIPDKDMSKTLAFFQGNMSVFMLPLLLFLARKISEHW